MTLGVEIKAGPISTTAKVISVSIVWVSERNTKSAKFSITMDIPNVTNKIFSSRPWLDRLITIFCNP